MSRSTRSVLCFAALPLVMLSLAGSHRAADSVAERAREILAGRCHRCHGQDGRSAAGVTVLDRDRLVTSGVVVPGDARSRLLEAVSSGRMPLGGPPLSEDDVDALREWILAGARAFDGPAVERRRRVSEVELLDRILADLNAASSRSRPFLRYVSLAHMRNAGASDDDLDLARAAASKLVNSLSWERYVIAPAPIDPDRVLLRLDLRDYGWKPETWSVIERAYPYGVRFAAADAIAEATGARLPYIRGDWLVAEASVEPLYGELLGLPATVAELERLLTVDAARNLEREHGVLRAGVRQSGVSQHNRVVERHVTPYGAYWKSYDFSESTGARDIFSNPVDLAADGGEMIFNLPNGLQGYYLADRSGRHLDAGPIEIVSDRTQPDDPLVRNGRSCIGCHVAGVKPLRDDVRAVLSGSAPGRYDRAKAFALYVPQPELDAVLEEDAARFTTALARVAEPGRFAREVEPVSALARRYAADLGAREAAAEIGLATEEFQKRLALLGSSTGVELAGLAVRGGGVKREVWEERFSEVAVRLGLGSPVVARLDRWAGRTPHAAVPDRVTRSGRRLFVRTKTKFFTPSLLEVELRKRPSFAQNGFEVVRDAARADLEVLVDRPLFTYTYTYTVTDRRTGTVVASGRLTAFDGNVAAPKIAKELEQSVLTR